MTVTIRGAGEARRAFRKIEEFLRSTKPMEGIVADIKETILNKTGGGHDYMGRNFKPYSKAYAKKKGTSRPDLRVSGAMLGAIKTKVLAPRHGQVYVASEGTSGNANTDMLAQIHNTGTGKQPRREFMNLSKSAVQQLKKKHIDDPLLQLAREAR